MAAAEMLDGALTGRAAQAVKYWPTTERIAVVVPPHPRRTTAPYCRTCGVTAPAHWNGCPNETEGDS